MTEVKEKSAITPAQKVKKLSENIVATVTNFKDTGTIKLPKDYSVENSLRFAFLKLSESVDKDKKPVLESCSEISIANAMLSMCVQALNPMKSQCYFIAFGGKLTLMRSYQGSVAMAKRVGLKTIHANCIYKDDIFKFEVDKETGRKKLIEHTQDFTKMDNANIIGAYCIYSTEEGSDIEIMNKFQITKAWAMGQQKGDGNVHKDFNDEMSKKTVIMRACRNIINQSDDAYLMEKESEEETPVKEEINTKTAALEVHFDDAEEIAPVIADTQEPTKDPVCEPNKLF